MHICIFDKYASFSCLLFGLMFPSVLYMDCTSLMLPSCVLTHTIDYDYEGWSHLNKAQSKHLHSHPAPIFSMLHMVERCFSFLLSKNTCFSTCWNLLLGQCWHCMCVCIPQNRLQRYNTINDSQPVLFTTFYEQFFFS